MALLRIFSIKTCVWSICRGEWFFRFGLVRRGAHPLAAWKPWSGAAVLGFRFVEPFALSDGANMVWRIYVQGKGGAYSPSFFQKVARQRGTKWRTSALPPKPGGGATDGPFPDSPPQWAQRGPCDVFFKFFFEKFFDFTNYFKFFLHRNFGKKNALT